VSMELVGRLVTDVEFSDAVFVNKGSVIKSSIK
jgi:hypothetical protein